MRLPILRVVQNSTRKEAEARTEAVKATIKLYKEQATRDY
jgi:hypothetical protein